ncbi:MAG TPA: hypothetical protein ENJ09_00905 [Planctomycetes bacterium]|nr:hypothetical protein [Planctomycetota bacterium]
MESPEESVPPVSAAHDSSADPSTAASVIEASAPSLSPEELRASLARLESEYRYGEALRVLDALVAIGGGDRDELLRQRRTIEAFVDLAEESYAAADSARDPAEELFYLSLIRSFWPGYRDVDERLLALRAAKGQGDAPGRHASTTAKSDVSAPPADHGETR